MMQWLSFRGAPLLAALLFAGEVPAQGQNPLFPVDVWNDAIPGEISETGVYSDPEAKQLADKAVPFDVNSPLWTDGAAKRRYIALPPGEKVQFRADDDYVFPEGALLIKEFALDTIAGDSSSRVWVETRLLLLQDGEWHGFTYRWDESGKKAYLADAEGENAVYKMHSVGGATQELPWRFPSRAQCQVCHVPGGRQALGFLTPQLNGPDRHFAGSNQMERLFHVGVFEGEMPELHGLHRWHSLEDQEATLENRARGYLAANCSNCHGEKGRQAGATFARMDFDYLTEGKGLDYLDLRAIKNLGHEGILVVEPGSPEESMLVKRLRSRDGQNQMPPIGSHVPDSAAIAVVSAWIRSLGEVNGLEHGLMLMGLPESELQQGHDAAGRRTKYSQERELPSGIMFGGKR